MSPPPDPDRIARAMVSPLWSGLIRTGADIKTIGSWDTGLIRHPRLLVPIDVQALYVARDSKEAFVRLPFTLTTPDGKDPEAMPEPFSEGKPRAPGIHLHWALPDSLLSGELREVETGSRNRLGLPALPDRWVVLRIVVPRRGLDRAAMRGWVIEADTTRVAPLETWPDASIAPTGKTVAPDELSGSVGGTLNWTGVYDAVANRFAFHDPLDDLDSLPGGGALGNTGTYVVAGWWSKPELDPLDSARSKASFYDRLETLGWRLARDLEGGDQLPAEAGLVQMKRASIGLESGDRYKVGQQARSEQKISAAQSYEPGRSIFAEEASRVVKTPPRHLFSTLLHGTVYGVPLGGRVALRDLRPDPKQTGIAIGLHGDDVAAALATEGMGITDPDERRDTERILSAFTGQRLEELGTADGVIDVEEHEHASGFESRHGGPGGAERIRLGGEAGPLPAGRGARSAQANGGKRKTATFGAEAQSPRMVFEPGARSELARKTTAELRSEIDSWTEKATGGPPLERSRVVERSAPRYFRPLEPIVAVRNALRSLRHRRDGRFSPDGKMTCRWPTQVGTRMEGVLDAAGLLPDLPAGAIPPEVLSLARNTVLLDPYIVTWLAQQAARQSAVPQAQAQARLKAEAALRFGGATAAYGGALPVTERGGRGATRLVGAMVTDQLRRFSLVAGVDPDPVAVTTWIQPWVPLWLEWEVELAATDRLDGVRLEAVDLEPVEPTWLPDAPPRRLRGRSALNTGAAKTLAAAIDAWMAAETARDAENAGEADDATEDALAAIADEIEDLDVLSASLDSLQEQLLGLPLGDFGVLNPRQDGGPALGKPVPVDVPQLIVNGALRLTRARIIDAFGRTLDLPIERTQVPERCRVPDSPPGTLRLTPRLMRPARWMFRLVDPANLGPASPEATIDQIDQAAMINPVAGFLLPDHIDEALELFDTDGSPLGQLMHEPFGGGVAWEIAPGRPGPSDAGPLFELQTAQQILGYMASGLVAVDAATRKGASAETDTESALSAMLRAIDTTLWTVDTFSNLGTAHIAGLVGRPIAVVRAILRLEIDDDLDELDLSDAALRAAREAAYRDLADRAFSVRIGELTRSDDGLLGFFVDDDYSRFHVVDKAVRDGALDGGHGRGHLAQKGSIPQIPPVRPILHPYLMAEDELRVHPGQVVRLTLLLHPAGKVHLTSGVLPRKSLMLARDWTFPGLSVMAPSARVGPVLIEPGDVRLPRISSFPKEQVWTRRDSPVTWRDDPILAATQTALLPELPAEVQEGYIRVGPPSPETPSEGEV
ncbi:MAG: hypothetical protein BroJett029_00470 [Alphaproteobacteria bacterium]|nr:MAG: hypothetical protein BroJett029_00470 [Alphaproteobacteria bacterium]